MRKITKRGFTLVELMIVVAIIGVLAALAIFGVRKYLANAKTSEAKNTIGAINRSAVAAYNRETAESSMLAPGTTGTQAVHSLCTSSVAVPSALSKVANRKYQPDTKNDTDFNVGTNTASWKCLKFAMTEPIYFQYKYTQAAGPAMVPNLTLLNSSGSDQTWYAEAQGDLDGDTIPSEFLTGGAISNGEPIKATEVKENNPEE